MSGPIWAHTTYLVDADTTLEIKPRASGRGLHVHLGQGPSMIAIGLLDDSAERLLEALQEAVQAQKSYHRTEEAA